jgi:poly(A) polymerase Pap1
VTKLEDHASIALAHPFNKGFVRAHRCRTVEEIDAVNHGSMNFHAKDIATTTSGHGLALEPTGKDGAPNGENKLDEENITLVYTTTHYIGLELREGKSIISSKTKHPNHPDTLFCGKELPGFYLRIQPSLLVCPSANTSRCKIS